MFTDTKKSLDSSIEINFEGERFNGYITELDAKNRTDTYRIFFEEDLCDRLKKAFLMSFMRDLEFKHGQKEYNIQRLAIEDVISFNEFLDIEWDSAGRRMIFTAHYRQKAIFPHLFRAIAKSTTLLTQLDREVSGKKQKIHSSGWNPKSELEKLGPDVKNVIYYLIDESNRELYIGEATSLQQRLKGHRDEIPGWTHFRYEKLTDDLEPLREELQTMVITAMAYMFPSRNEKISPKNVSGYSLKNKKMH